MIKIAKEFIWEMSHRLPFHEGGCKNVHGHSYKMTIFLEGDLDKNGMVLDFYHIVDIVQPLIDKLDHAFICDPNDNVMIDFLKANAFKFYIIDKNSTAENLSSFFLNEFKPKFAEFHNLHYLGVRVYETLDAYAEIGSHLQ